MRRPDEGNGQDWRRIGAPPLSDAPFVGAAEEPSRPPGESGKISRRSTVGASPGPPRSAAARGRDRGQR
eukprot:8170764-Pyramimonas_sp.AAC.1